MIGQVVAAYWQVILQFLAELYVFYILVMFRFNRAKYFAAKFFGGLAAVAAKSFGLSIIYHFIGGKA